MVYEYTSPCIVSGTYFAKFLFKIDLCLTERGIVHEWTLQEIIVCMDKEIVPKLLVSHENRITVRKMT